jgi:hypothetical protein
VQIKKDWKKLRDYYVAEKKLGKTMSGMYGEKESVWPYFVHLTWLDSALEKRKRLA